MTMHPVIPSDFKHFEAPGCCVREVARPAGTLRLWSVTLWLNGNVYQRAIYANTAPTLTDLMGSFMSRPLIWAPVASIKPAA